MVAILEVIKLDPNLTNPIIDATLNQPPNTIIDLLPSIGTIVVLTIGGVITYYSVIKSERIKRESEVKKEIFFEILKTLPEIRRKSEKLENHRRENDNLLEIARSCLEQGKELPDDFPLDSEIDRKTNELVLESTSFVDMNMIQDMKLRIYGSDEVYNAYQEVKKVFRDEETFNEKIYKQLIPRMKDDLRSKHWWEFWK